MAQSNQRMTADSVFTQFVESLVWKHPEGMIALCRAQSQICLRPGSMAYSNLRARGPDFEAPEGILFGDGFTGRRSNGHVVGVLASQAATRLSLPPPSAHTSGTRGDAACIGWWYNAEVVLAFTFIVRRALWPVPVGRTPSLEVSADMSSPIILAYFSLGQPTTDGKEAAKVTHSSKQRSDTLNCPGSTPFFRASINLRVAKEKRSLRCMGGAPITCPPRATCAGFACPDGATFRRDPDSRRCLDVTCSANAAIECCEDFLPGDCGQRRALLPCSVLSSNWVGCGPVFLHSRGVFYSSVFSRGGTTVDLLMEYASNQAQPSGLPTIGFDSAVGYRGGTAVMLKGIQNGVLHFQFLVRATQGPAILPPSFSSLPDIYADQGLSTSLIKVWNSAVYNVTARNGLTFDGERTFRTIPVAIGLLLGPLPQPMDTLAGSTRPRCERWPYSWNPCPWSVSSGRPLQGFAIIYWYAQAKRIWVGLASQTAAFLLASWAIR